MHGCSICGVDYPQRVAQVSCSRTVQCLQIQVMRATFVVIWCSKMLLNAWLPCQVSFFQTLKYLLVCGSCQKTNNRSSTVSLTGLVRFCLSMRERKQTVVYQGLRLSLQTRSFMSLRKYITGGVVLSFLMANHMKTSLDCAFLLTRKRWKVTITSSRQGVMLELK